MRLEIAAGFRAMPCDRHFLPGHGEVGQDAYAAAIATE
jgi:hypothetical protein